MNGIVVMDCVQTAYHGERGVYGVRDRLIRISGRRTDMDVPADASGEKSSRNPVKKAGRQAAGSNRSYSSSPGRKPEPVDSNRCPSRRKSRSRREVSGSDRASAAAGISVLRMLVLVLILTGSIAGFQMITGAHSRSQQKAWKYHTTVTIPCGGTVDDIVDTYCNSSYYNSREDYLREVCEINGLPFEKGSTLDLKAGTMLVIPYYSTEYK